MALDIKVKIDLTKPTGSAGYSYPLILEAGATKAVPFTLCSTLSEVEAAGYASTTNTYKAAKLMFSQNNPPKKVAVCGVTAASELSYFDNEWRQLMVVDSGSTATDISGIITAVENSKNKLLFVQVEAASELGDLSASDRIIGFVHTEDLAVAAFIGEAAGHDVGTITYKNLILTDIEPMDLTDAELTAIHTANGVTAVTKAGDVVSSEGKALSGEYIDIIDAKDYVISQLEYNTQKVLNESDKVPYDNNGIALLESAAVSVMKDCYGKGIIATDDDGNPMYTVDYALRDQATDEQRVARKYLGGQFTFHLAGAIHEVEITGEIIV